MEKKIILCADIIFKRLKIMNKFDTTMMFSVKERKNIWVISDSLNTAHTFHTLK